MSGAVARDDDALAPEYARRLGDELAHKSLDRAWLGAVHAAIRPGGERLVAVHLGEGVTRPGELWGIPLGLGFRLFAPGEMDAALRPARFEVVESAARLPHAGVEAATRRASLRAVR